MPLHPVIAELVATLPPAPEDGSLVIDPVAARRDEQQFVPAPEDRLPVDSVEDDTAKTAAGEVPVRIYRNKPDEKTGIIVYFHGGAFFSGSLDTHDFVARALARETGFTVVSVGYRLAPEAAFPAGLDDCYGVLRWAAEHGDELSWDGQRLAVAGDSSGGNFTAVVAAMAHDDGFDALTHQVLFYPSVDLDFDEDRFPSLRENARGYGLEAPALLPHNSFYLNSGADPDDPTVSPIKRKDLSGLPKALILTAQYDPLRDEGEAYGQRLTEAGVDARVHRYESANHGFVANFGQIPEFYAAFTEAGEFLNS